MTAPLSDSRHTSGDAGAIMAVDQEAAQLGRSQTKGDVMAEERERLEAEERDDTEGHRVGRPTEDTSGDDVEGHRVGRPTEDVTGDEDDVEGHRVGRPT